MENNYSEVFASDSREKTEINKESFDNVELDVFKAIFQLR